MGLVDDFERRLEGLVEGVFSKAFRSDIEPAELGRRMLREMEDGKSVSVGAVYVPNDYLLTLSGEDYARLEGLMPTLRTEFIALLKSNAGQRRWRLPGAIDVRFQMDETLKRGKFDVTGLHLATESLDQPAEPDTLSLLGTDRQWQLTADDMTIGRSSSNQVILDDPNASRTHARLSKRLDEWWITDLDSTNGTLVNEAVIKERRLISGDRIKIGGTELEYRQAGQPDQ